MWSAVLRQRQKVCVQSHRQHTHFTRDVSGEVAVGGEFETAGVLRGAVHNVNVPGLQNTEKDSVTRKEQRSSRLRARAHLVYPQFPHDDVVHRRRHFAPHVMVPTRVELQVDVSFGAETIGYHFKMAAGALNRHASH